MVVWVQGVTPHTRDDADDSLLPFVVVRGQGVTPHTRLTTVRMTSPTTASFLHASSSLSWPLVVWVQGAAPLTRVDADDSLLLVVVGLGGVGFGFRGLGLGCQFELSSENQTKCDKIEFVSSFVNTLMENRRISVLS